MKPWVLKKRSEGVDYTIGCIARLIDESTAVEDDTKDRSDEEEEAGTNLLVADEEADEDENGPGTSYLKESNEPPTPDYLHCKYESFHTNSHSTYL